MSESWDYQPTSHLQFVERQEPVGETKDGGTISRTIRVLQQLYRSPWAEKKDEWRDVPLATSHAQSNLEEKP
jgi:hypothetical protein